jgi:trimeric autotransporter adhesin
MSIVEAGDHGCIGTVSATSVPDGSITVSLNHQEDWTQINHNKYLFRLLANEEHLNVLANPAQRDNIEVQSTKVWFGGTQVTNRDALYSAPNLTVITYYNYQDVNARKNGETWKGLASEYAKKASAFTEFSTAFKNWYDKIQNYNTEYQTKLTEISTVRTNATQEFDNKIAELKTQKKNWINTTYGYVVDGEEGTIDNPNSDYRKGEAAWKDKITEFKKAELAWFQESKAVLKDAVENPVTGETKFIQDGTTAVREIQENIDQSEDITASEFIPYIQENVGDLYNNAERLWAGTEFENAKLLVDQSIYNKTNEVNQNALGVTLSTEIRNSNGRSEDYKRAELAASNRINGLQELLNGNTTVDIQTHTLGNYTSLVATHLASQNVSVAVSGTELTKIQTDINHFVDRQNYWQEEIDGTPGVTTGFGFAHRKEKAEERITYLNDVKQDLIKSAEFKQDVLDKESDILAIANTLSKKSDEFKQLADELKNKGDFDKAEYYAGLGIEKKKELRNYLNEEYKNLVKYIGSEIENRNLTHTKQAFTNFMNSLVNKNSKDNDDIAKLIHKNEKEKEKIVLVGNEFKTINELLEQSKTLTKKSEDSKTAVEKLMDRANELANKNLGGDLLAGINQKVDSILSSIPEVVGKNSGAKEAYSSLDSMKANIENMLSNMESLMMNESDVKMLYDFMNQTNTNLNFAANSAIIHYMDKVASRLVEENKKRGETLTKSLLEELQTDAKYKYLRDASYVFTGSDGYISGSRQIKSGEFGVNGVAMEVPSYYSLMMFQYITIQTKFEPPALQINSLSIDDLNNFEFNADLVLNVMGSMKAQEESIALAYEKFKDKTAELQSHFDYNKLEEEHLESVYKETTTSTAKNFKDLHPVNFSPTFSKTMEGFRDMYSKMDYNLGEDGNTFVLSRKLTGKVNVPTSFGPVPVDMDYGEQFIRVPKSFLLEELKYNFVFDGKGNYYIQNKIFDVNDVFQKFIDNSIQKITKQAEANDAEKESKGFLFSVLNGMQGQGGNIGKAFTKSLQNEVTGRIKSAATSAIAEATVYRLV